MKTLIKTPLDETVANWWNAIEREYRKAFLVIIAINLLAFGFEMSNLTLHHDDVAQLFIQDSILGRYVGRFGLGWLNYYGQNAYFMPFLQMLVPHAFECVLDVRVHRADPVVGEQGMVRRGHPPTDEEVPRREMTVEVGHVLTIGLDGVGQILCKLVLVLTRDADHVLVERLRLHDAGCR